MSSTPGTEAPFKYTKDSFIGVRDAWVSFAAARFSKTAADLKLLTDKLPAVVKSTIAKAMPSKPTDTTGASAPS
jgi:hypothetical protein